MRNCACDHGFPLCACALGLAGAALLLRSRQISSRAGWPGPIDPAEAGAIAAELVRERRARKPRGPLGTGTRSRDCDCGSRS